MEHEDDGDTNCGWCTWNNPQRIGESIIRINQNTEYSPGDLSRLAVTQTPMKNHQLMLV